MTTRQYSLNVLETPERIKPITKDYEIKAYAYNSMRFEAAYPKGPDSPPSVPVLVCVLHKAVNAQATPRVS